MHKYLKHMSLIGKRHGGGFVRTADRYGNIAKPHSIHRKVVVRLKR